MIVCKFGGTSVSDAAAIERGAAIVEARRGRRPVVVVSAMSGVTNMLLALAEQASRGQLIGALRAVEQLRERHLEAADELLPKADADVPGELSVMFDELAHLAEALSVLGHLTPRSLDAIAAHGERASSLLVAAAFRHREMPATHVDARDIVITDDAFTRAEPLPDRIADATRRVLLPMLRRDEIPVLGGYIGATKTGLTTTLGRGGSDYSASLIGAALRAEAIEIWTDVDGMLTGDPKVVNGARTIDEIRFDEASELATFGAKVLHPNTIAPAVKLGIPVFVLNSYRPEGTGTRITFDAPRRAIRAVAGKRGITLVKVRTPRMLLTHGFLRQFFEIFERNGISVDVVATSEVSISVTIDDDAHVDRLLVDLRALGDVSIERHRGVVAIVGAALSEDAASMAKAINALHGMSLQMLALSATGINLTIIVQADEVEEAMRRLHDAFFGGNSR